MEIIPAILTKDPVQLDGWLRKVRDSKRFERVQIDFIDGEYAANRTIKPSECDLIPYLPLKFDAHLMVVEDNILQWWKTAEKMGFDRIASQVESISNPDDFRGLAIDVHSPTKALEPYLSRLELVIVMAVEPGFGGQEFVDKAVGHSKELVDLRKEKNYKYRICVDGGVEQEHLEMLKNAGIDEVAVGVPRVLSWNI